MKNRATTIIDCLKDDNLFKPHFPGKSWRSWRIFLRALFSLSMGLKSKAVFCKRTQRQTLPSNVTEAWLVELSTSS